LTTTNTERESRSSDYSARTADSCPESTTSHLPPSMNKKSVRMRMGMRMRMKMALIPPISPTATPANELYKYIERKAGQNEARTAASTPKKGQENHPSSSY